MYGAQAGQVILASALVGGVEVLPDVEAKNAAARGPELRSAHVGEESIDAVVVEAETIDERFGFRQAEEPRFWIAGLRPRRHSAAFDEAETQSRQPVDMRRVLVQS